MGLCLYILLWWPVLEGEKTDVDHRAGFGGSPFEWTALHSPKMSLHFCLISQCLMGRNEKGCKMDVNERQKRRPSTGWKSAVGSTLTKKSAVSSTVDVNHWPTKIENNEIFLVFKIFNFFGTFGIRACFESL